MGNASGREEGASGVYGSSYARSDDGSAVLSPAADHLPPGSPPGHVASSDSMGGSPPASPRRSRSPPLFTPQHPVAPLQTVDYSPPLDPTRRSDPQAPLDFAPERGIPTLITWSHGGNNVVVEGSWDNWASRKVLHSTGKDHSLLLVLPSGIFHYQFIIDGEIRHTPDLPFVSDEMGNVCNVLDVHEYVPESLESVCEFEAPASPDWSYGQDFPREEDLSKEPAAVPSPLHLTVLGVVDDGEGGCMRPQHVVLNHLFIEKGWAAQSVVTLGLTHRFQSKYVTVVLYKPVIR